MQVYVQPQQSGSQVPLLRLWFSAKGHPGYGWKTYWRIWKDVL